jgi:hypothetical protein
LPWPAHADRVGALYANDFKLPTTIARIIVVQNLSCLQHNPPFQPMDQGDPTGPMSASMTLSKINVERSRCARDVRVASGVCPAPAPLERPAFSDCGRRALPQISTATRYADCAPPPHARSPLCSSRSRRYRARSSQLDLTSRFFRRAQVATRLGASAFGNCGHAATWVLGCNGPSLCENSTRYKRTLNFEACGRAQSKKRKNSSSARHYDQIRFCQPGPVADMLRQRARQQRATRCFYWGTSLVIVTV